MHWVSVAVRESVINAIKHGNREDISKQVTVEFTFAPKDIRPSSWWCSTRARARPVEVANPLAPENMLKSSGRGIFF